MNLSRRWSESLSPLKAAISCALFTLALLAGSARAQAPDQASQPSAGGPAQVREVGAPDDDAASARAHQHFQRAVEYYASGDLRPALIELERAYAFEPTYRLLYNLGQVASELRDYAQAERFYRAYLKRGADAVEPERRAEVEQELARLGTRVATLRLELDQPDASVRIDDHPVAHPGSKPVRVSAGERRIEAEKAGYAPVHRTLEIAGGEERVVKLEFGPPLSHAQPPARVAVVARDSVSALPWITGIASAALALAGAGIGYWAYADSSAYERELQHYTTQRELDQFSTQVRAKALIADTLLGTALVGAVVTTVLILNEPSTDLPPAGRKRGVALEASGLRVRF